MLQIRPRGGYSQGRDPMYAPHRDVAYIGPQLLVSAIAEVLNPADWEPWFKSFIEQHNLSMEALHNGAMQLMETFGDISSLRCSFPDALRRSGFSSMPAAVQAAFYMKMGKYLLAAMHRGLGDITDYDGPVPPHIDDMVSDIRKLADKACRVV